jgi:thymidylate kinase
MRIVAFIGLDGSGKTTQAEAFAARRAAEGVSAAYAHQFRFDSRRVMAAKARLRPFLLRAQAAVSTEGSVRLAPNADDAARRGPLRRALQRLFLVPPLAAGALLLGLHRTRAKLRRSRRRGVHTLVLDRYFFDELVRVEWKLGLRLPCRALWLRLAPPPDLTVYFEIPGEVSWERMEPRDSTRDAMRRKELAYREWLPLIARRARRLLVVPVVGRTIDAVAAEVEGAWAALAGGAARRAGAAGSPGQDASGEAR